MGLLVIATEVIVGAAAVPATTVSVGVIETPFTVTVKGPLEIVAPTATSQAMLLPPVTEVTWHGVLPPPTVTVTCPRLVPKPDPEMVMVRAAVDTVAGTTLLATPPPVVVKDVTVAVGAPTRIATTGVAAAPFIVTATLPATGVTPAATVHVRVVDAAAVTVHGAVVEPVTGTVTDS